MCRYVNKVYKSHFACFNCRKTFKESYSRDFLDKQQGIAIESADFLEVRVCPQCKGEMFDMGFDFKAPKQSEIKQ